MAEIAFDLGQLFETTFGYKTQAFEPEFKEAKGVKPPGRTEQGAYGSAYYGRSALGREYYMPVTLTYPDERDIPEPPPGLAFGTGDNTVTVLKKWDLPNPVIAISSRKVVVETPMTERRGTVKELINIEDYEIVIKGFIIGEANEFPEAEVATLREVYEKNVALSIQCPLTDLFLLRPGRNGSDKVVIKELRLPSITGVKNIRPYELYMVSDEAFSLVLV
jgi:hypothetical protein